jgi:hypothetical protein
MEGFIMSRITFMAVFLFLSRRCRVVQYGDWEEILPE